MLSLRTPEYAVRRMVSAISPAIESSVFLNSSNPIGSRGLSIVTASSSDLPPELDGDVAVGVERGPRAGRHHAGGIVLLDDARALARGGESRAVEDWRLAPAEGLAEVHAPRGLVAPAGAIGADPLGHARPVG